MKTAELLSQVAEVEAASESIPLLVDTLSISHDELAKVDVSKMETEPDYAMEHALEVALELVNSGDLAGDDLVNVSRLVAENWLTLENIPGGTPREINVRAAEFLTTASPKTGTVPYPEDHPLSMETVRELLSSEDWKSRYLGALLAREHFADDSAALLEPLSQDPFEDEDGIFLVREAAGFSDDEG
jgi:hypothetical protein